MGDRSSARRAPPVIVGLLAGSLVAAASACSITLDEDDPVWPLEGVAPAPRQQIVFPLRATSYLVEGADGAKWIALSTVQEGISDATLRVVRLADPPLEENLDSGLARVGKRALYLHRFDGPSRSLVVHRPGDPDERRFLTSAFLFDFIGSSPDDSAFAWRETDRLHIWRTDGSYHRTVEGSAGVVGWSDDGEYAFVALFPGNGKVKRRHRILSTRSEFTLDLHGVRPDWEALHVDFRAADGVALYCGLDSGLIAIPLDGSPHRRLDTSCYSVDLLDLCVPYYECQGGAPNGGPSVQFRPFENPTSGIVYAARKADAWPDVTTFPPNLAGSSRQGVLRSVTLDGAPPIDLVPLPTWPLALHPAHAASHDPAVPSEHVNAWSGAVDGNPVMTRGRMLRFSSDGTRVRFLEHTADVLGTGDLMTAVIGSPPELVARNCLRYDELPDGRLIAVTNVTLVGDRARVVLVDEARRTMAPLAEMANGYLVIPGTGEALVRQVSLSFNAPQVWVRVPIPPRAP